MSVVVRMEMPKGCWNCPCVNGEYGYCQADKDERQIEGPNERPSWCPIIAASPWHRVEEPPKETGKYAVCWTYQEKIYWDWLIFFDGNWELRAGLPLPDYWMPIEPPKEDA